MLLKRKQVRKTLVDGIGKGLLFACCLISIGLFAGIAFHLIKNGLKGFEIRFLISSASVITEHDGIREYFVNTLWLFFLTLPTSRSAAFTMNPRFADIERHMWVHCRDVS